METVVDVSFHQRGASVRFQAPGLFLAGQFAIGDLKATLGPCGPLFEADAAALAACEGHTLAWLEGKVPDLTPPAAEPTEMEAAFLAAQEEAAGEPAEETAGPEDADVL